MIEKNTPENSGRKEPTPDQLRSIYNISQTYLQGTEKHGAAVIQNYFLKLCKIFKVNSEQENAKSDLAQEIAKFNTKYPELQNRGLTSKLLRPIQEQQSQITGVIRATLLEPIEPIVDDDTPQQGGIMLKPLAEEGEEL